MSKKLQNMKAVRQMLDGTHKFQTKKITGFSDAKETAERNKKREIGDIWEEKDPRSGSIYVIEQCQGFRTKKPKNSIAKEIREYLNSYPNCSPDCKTTTYNHLDKKMKKIHGMCFDCVIQMEHELRVNGKYEEYEKKRIRANAESWLKDAEQDVQALKTAFTEAQQYVTNADGLTETWAAQMTPEEFEEKVEAQWEEFKKDFLSNLNGEKVNEDD
jgi:ElaB/YqjD/DUF883 family membrane-anchored ribosome-binding protein